MAEEVPGPGGVPGAVLEVGAPPQLEEELLVLYFESRRRSGGGPVRSCQRLGPLLFLTFESPQDAQNVLARDNHRLGGVELEVRPAAPWDPSYLLLGGLDPQAPPELLEQRLETLLGRSPSAVTLSQGPPGWGLLHLRDPLTPQELWLAEGRARGSSLRLLRVPQTPSLLVEGGGSPLSPDLLELYFENRRSGGGPVRQLQLLPGGRAAIVTFQELAVAQRVLQRRNHRLQDLALILAPHYPFLGAMGRDQDPLTVGRDPPINTEPMAPDTAPLSDRDAPRDKDPPRDRDPPRVMDPPKDRGVPRDEDPPRVMDPPRDKDPPRDRDSPRVIDPPRDRAPLIQTAPPGVTDPPRDTDSQRVMDPPRDMDPLPAPAPRPPPDPGRPSVPPSAIAVGAQLVSGEGEEEEEEEVVVPGERGSVRYLQQHCQDLLGSISHVSVLPLEGGDVAGFRVSGERRQCRAVGEFLQNLLGTVGTWPLTLHFPGVARFLRDQGGRSLLQQVEEQFQCVIELEGICWSPPEQQLDLVELLPQCCHQDPPAVAPPPPHWGLLGDADGDSEEITELLATLHPGDNAGEPGDTLGWQQDPGDDIPPAYYPQWGSRVGEEEEVQMALAIQHSMEIEQHQEEEALERATALSLRSYREEEEEEEALAHATALSLSSYHQEEEEEAEAAVLQVALEASLEEALLAADSARVTVFTVQEAPEVLVGLERALAGRLQTQEVTHERLQALPPSYQHPLALLQCQHAVRLTLRPGTATFSGFPPYTSQAARELQNLLQNLPEPQPGFGAGAGGIPSGTTVRSASGTRGAAGGCLVEEGVRLLALSPHSLEFQEVVRNFYSSLGDLHSRVSILQVQKLEHPLLARQYQLKKVSVERACGGACVERVLFHGTTQSSSHEICLHGFNRSFCGKNAALYGRGVYFAVRSVLSARDLYSPRSPDGTKFIFVAKVLTGLFTKGGPGLRAPPLREGVGVPLRYHSVVDDPRHPNVFVIFNDTQAYPQYLLICRCRGPPH
ncbi:protein mono-ADP-ribosyltransferase PARP10 [Phaethornis superciliosus]